MVIAGILKDLFGVGMSKEHLDYHNCHIPSWSKVMNKSICGLNVGVYEWRYGSSKSSLNITATYEKEKSALKTLTGCRKIAFPPMTNEDFTTDHCLITYQCLTQTY